MAFFRVATIAGLLLTFASTAVAAEQAGSYAQWKNWPGKDASFFPIAVWCQDPALAPKYQKAGINLYMALWGGPTEAQLAELKKYGMPVICDQNKVGLARLSDPIIAGWMHGDEPDNAQSLPGGNGYGPPILPAKIIKEYEAIRKADPSRPVMLNLGESVAWDGFPDRGVRSHHPEDYAEYVKGCDITSFDIYPAANDRPQVKGHLDLVAGGVENLVKWCGGKKIVWNCIECTNISGHGKATPKQVKAEVWMSLVHGSQGLIYFVHQFRPKFDEHALLDDPEMLAGVTAINGQIRELARALNSPTIEGEATVESENRDVPVAVMVKKQGGSTYVFAVAMQPGATKATFTVAGSPTATEVTVLGEDRKIAAAGGTFHDNFSDWDVHLYRIR